MGSFNAGASVDTLDWSFEPYLKVKGVLKEPSDQQIGDFIDGLKAIFKTAKESGITEMEKLGDNPDIEDISAAIAMVGGKDYVKLNSELARHYSELCSGKPATDQILTLPLRARVHFYDWLQTEVINPEAGSGGGARVVPIQPREVTGR